MNQKGKNLLTTLQTKTGNFDSRGIPPRGVFNFCVRNTSLREEGTEKRVLVEEMGAGEGVEWEEGVADKGVWREMGAPSCCRRS